MIRLDGKVILITGAASGFGLATAIQAQALGARVVLAGRRAEHGRSVAEGLGPDVLFIPADVSVEDDVQRLVATALERCGRLDIVVNNAGIIRRIPVADEDVAGWDAVIAVNLRGTFLCCKYALPSLVATRGAIVNVSSVFALATPHGRTPAYDASKAGMVALTRAIAVHYGPQGVRANAVCPGFVTTDLNRNLWERWTEAERAAYVESFPLRRAGTPDDVARAIIFLASDAASWISGVALPIDGGRAAM
jgi:NAD(P)-dependent dehydrogenase (short-subunit alcohol dehydrogenase family)